MSYEPVHWGILSTAHINRLVIPPARESPKVDLIAVASRSQEAADEYARKWEIPRAHGSYEALLADPDVEAIYISLPNSLHVEWSINALEAGKHVLCEKPFDQRPERVEEAFDVAERQGLHLMEAFMYRHHPQTAKLIELVEGGAIGTLQAIRSDVQLFALRRRQRPPADGRRGRRADGRRLLLRPQLARARRRAGARLRRAGRRSHRGRRSLPRDDAVSVRRRQPVGLRDGHAGTGRAGGDRRDGLALPRRPVPLRRAGHRASPRRRGTERIEVESADPYGLELENLSDAIRGEGGPLLGREDAVAQARAIAALRRSAESGAPVEL